MTILLSLHDVTPARADECRELWGLCEARGLTPMLLVVPDYHGQAPLDGEPSFREWLERCARRGAEVALHGYYHRSRARFERRGDGAPGRLSWHFAQRIASGGEAEFSDVTRTEAALLLARGRAMLSRAGLRCSGFVAPAWSMQSWLPSLLAEHGFTFCESHRYFFDLCAARRLWSPVLNFATRSAWRAASSVAWTRLVRLSPGSSPLRVALHPGDLHHARVRSELRDLLDWAALRGTLPASALCQAAPKAAR